MSRTEEEGEPTPYIVEDVPYWISVNINPVLENGQVLNLYGRRFSMAKKEILDLGVKNVLGDKRNNIIAMAAPSCGKNEYKRKELEKLVKTVFAAFAGAVKCGIGCGRKKSFIHTGNWGAGAFANNRELIYLVQLIGASAVGISKLIFHCIDEKDFANAEKKFSDWTGNCSFSDLIDFLQERHYFWKVGDGN